MERLTLIIITINFIACSSRSPEIQINADFPGGNIIVQKIENDTVFLQPDNRDSEKPWFYWYFQANSVRSGTVIFKFTQQNSLTSFGPAVSTDGGKSWNWLFQHPLDQNYFQYIFSSHEQPVSFSMGMPYLQKDLEEFCRQYSYKANFTKSALCVSNKGREIEMIRISPRTKDVKAKILITVRHHASEMMANYSMEGIIASVMAMDAGSFLSDYTEVMLLPFMDKDGVELGDQGKHRAPRDHNRDYAGESIYASTRQLRDLVPEWSEGLPLIALDLHCPWIKYNNNEIIYLVGSSLPHIEKEQIVFSETLEKHQEGLLLFKRANFLPFGKDWNTEKNFEKGMSFDQWAAGLPGIFFASTLEMPYANNEGQQVTPQSARSFGKDISKALNIYLQEKFD